MDQKNLIKTIKWAKFDIKYMTKSIKKFVSMLIKAAKMILTLQSQSRCFIL